MSERAWWVLYSIAFVVLLGILASLSGTAPECDRFNGAWLWCLR